MLYQPIFPTWAKPQITAEALVAAGYQLPEDCSIKGKRVVSMGPGRPEAVSPLALHFKNGIVTLWAETRLPVEYSQNPVQVPLMYFDDMESFNNYLRQNGRLSKGGIGPSSEFNSWD